MPEQSDSERIEAALPSVVTMAERDGADLRESGREHRCDHPHHNTPSSNGENLCLSSDGETWHCKRHDHGGGKLAWVAMSAGILECGDLSDGRIPRSLFRDVLEVAADRAGVELDPHAREATDHEREKLAAFDADRRTVAAFYHDCLDAHDKRAELKRRYGFSDALIDENLIGYAPPAGMAHDLPGETGIPADRLKRLGLWSSGGAPHFEDRFVFPYWATDRGERRCRYFTARAVNHDGGPKYLKIAKGGQVDTLAQQEPPFGIETVRGARRVIVTEGVTDALTLHDHGFAAVSPVTTHISGEALDEFARRLRGKEVYVIYDEDAGTQAGVEGAARDAYRLADKRVDAEVARLPARPNESVDVNEWFAEAGNDAQSFRTDVLGRLTYPAGVARWAWANGTPADVFSDAIESLGYDPTYARKRKDDDGDVFWDSVTEVLEGCRDLAEARRRFYDQCEWTAQVQKEAYFNVIRWTLAAHGEFFRADNGTVWFYHEPENETYTVCHEAEGMTAHQDLRVLVQRVFGVTSDEWGRNLLNELAGRIAAEAPERPTARLAYYHEDRQELYITSFDGHYYALDGASVERRRNGTDVFFTSNDRGEAYAYLEPHQRATLPDAVPGERPPFVGTGDLVHRLVCNRVNFDERANLSPALQRSQLYVHLHAMAFLTDFTAHPIMAWVGQKGSGKTVVLRSIGQFLYGPEWSESMMPSEQDDFVSKVSNRTLAAIDNYDDGTEWANDLLAAVATGASVEKRQLYTTNELSQSNPECWLALTSRDPPFRRDDVADRCLVFRVDRVDGEFISESKYLKQIALYRDDLWSEYLDNLNDVLAVRTNVDDEFRTTSHRMSDWALFARDAGEALDVPEVDTLLDGMQTERAFFALENEPLRIVVEEWLEANPTGGTYEASALLGEFEDAADDAGVHLKYSTSRGLSNALSSLSDELGELFGMEVVESRSGPKRYEFPGDAGTQYMLGYGDLGDRDDTDADADDSGGGA